MCVSSRRVLAASTRTIARGRNVCSLSGYGIWSPASLRSIFVVVFLLLVGFPEIFIFRFLVPNHTGFLSASVEVVLCGPIDTLPCRCARGLYLHSCGRCCAKRWQRVWSPAILALLAVSSTLTLNMRHYNVHDLALVGPCRRFTLLKI